MKPERKLWLDLKKNTPTICWNRIENLAVPGLPDLLGYNKHQHFFTVELKVTRSNKIRFSPHQIAFHVQHPVDTFILVKSLATRDWKLYEGKVIRELAARSLRLGALDKPFRVIRVEPRGIHAKIIGYEFLLTHTSLRSSHLDPGCPDSTIAHGRFPTSQLPVP